MNELETNQSMLGFQGLERSRWFQYPILDGNRKVGFMARLMIMLLCMAPAAAFALPNQIMQEGLVMDAEGTPFEGAHDIRVRLYDEADAQLPFYDERHPDIEFLEGFYAIPIGSIDPLDPAIFMRDNVWVGITIDNQAEMRPRTRLMKVPAAFAATLADDVRGDIHPASVSIQGVGVVINDEGEWVGSNVGLRGERGPAGPQGPVGPAGPAGDVIVVEDVGGLDDLPERVLNLLGQTDDPPFLRRNADDTTTGDYVFTGDANGGGTITFDGECCRTVLNLGNNRIKGVDSLEFADLGPGEGLLWRESEAKIYVAPASNANNVEGALRLDAHPDHGVRINSITHISGGLNVVDGPGFFGQINALVADLEVVTATNLNVARINGPNDRVEVNANLHLNGNVHIDDNTSFIGVIRTGGLSVASDAQVQGDLTARNLEATASVIAAGNVETGHAGLLRAGGGGVFVGDRQVFDGRGNLLARPTYACPQGEIMVGTTDEGAARCIRPICEAGRVFRGLNANWEPICSADERGLTTLPAIECPAGQAVIRMEANGRAHCGFPRSGDLLCADGEFVVGLDPNGTVICDTIPEPDEIDDNLRPQVLVCGPSALDLATLVRDADVDLQVESGCTPTDQTQAFIVMRDSADEYDPGLLRSYVRAGGIVLTEFGSSSRVFNDVFEEGVEPGERAGNCGDNINPPVRLNVRNKFWRDNNGVAENRALSGCGFRLDHFRDIVPLGGWEEQKVSLGYRDLGLGRVWMIESDWSDDGPTWTPESAALLAYMMGNGRRDGDLFEFEGIRENVSDARLIGWYMCYSSRYADNNLSLVDIKQRCNGDKLMLGCRPAGAPNWTLLAQGLRNEVLRNTGDGTNVLNRHNGVDWYYSENWSMGFAASGSGVSRNRCDTRGEPQRNNRLCWHTENGRVMGGYRCGARTGLTASTDWERAFFTNRNSAGLGDIYDSCKDALVAEQRQNGVYNVMPPGSPEPRRVYCDQQTDGGGWTLVGSSRGEPLGDTSSGYYEDVASLSPGSPHSGIWVGLRGFDTKFDVRFACRQEVGGTNDDMTVDLSFYDVPWYMEWTAGNDGDSCFEEDNGQGATQPTPARRNNLTQEELAAGDRYASGFLEGEDACGAEDDFTVDFDDRGMGGNGSDGTDWGMADGIPKCGVEGVNNGQWFVFVRERPVEIPEVDITDFEGVLTDYPDDAVDGWCQCHVSRYAQAGISLNEIGRICNGDSVMLGCRPAGALNWSVLAMGNRAEVFFPTGDNNNRTRGHNGVSWYYSRNQSMGFAPIGLAVDRASCDTENIQGDRRLCWHTELGNIKAGWRCGTERGLNGGLGWERAIWTRGGQSNCIPPQDCAADGDCDDESRTCQEGRCLPPPPECLVDRDCEDEFACQLGQCVEIIPDCEDDTDCAGENEVCFNGRCFAVAPPPVCQQDNECEGENICRDGQCVRPPCDNNEDCRQVDRINEQCIEGACLIPCRDVANCPREWFCNGDGYCQEPQ